MKTNYIAAVLCILTLASCKSVEFDDYVHEPTNDIRNDLLWSSGKVKPISKLTNEPVLLVPDLREFTASHHEHFVKLFVCSDSKITILVSDISLVNENTGYEFNNSINKQVTLEKRGYKDKGPYQTWVYLIKGSDINYNNFKGATELTLKVTYKVYSNSTPEEAETKTYKIQLKRVKGTAWIT